MFQKLRNWVLSLFEPQDRDSRDMANNNRKQRKANGSRDDRQRRPSSAGLAPERARVQFETQPESRRNREERVEPQIVEEASPVREEAEVIREREAVRESRHRQAVIRPMLESVLAARRYGILDYYTGDEGDGPSRRVLNVAVMQACLIRDLQIDIVKGARTMIQHHSIDDGLLEKIHLYCQAQRDLEYMQERAREGSERDPFIITTSRQHERDIMFHFSLVPGNFLTTSPAAPDRDQPALLGIDRIRQLHAAAKAAEAAEVAEGMEVPKPFSRDSAFLGSLALILFPILLESVPEWKYRLIVTGCTLALALAIAFRFNVIFKW